MFHIMFDVLVAGSLLQSQGNSLSCDAGIQPVEWAASSSSYKAMS